MRPATDLDIEEIKKTAAKCTQEIGFVIRGALVEAVKRKELLFEERSKSFCHYHTRKKDKVTVIYEICVPMVYRNKGIARTMVNLLPRPIELKCPVDNKSNDFYFRLGFSRVATVSGKKRALNVWRVE